MVRPASAAGPSAMKVVAAALVTEGAPCWALLLPGLGWLGPEVVVEVHGGLGSGRRRGARLGLGLWFRSGLRPWCVDGFEWLLGGGLEFRPVCGRGFSWGMGLGSSRGARGGDGFGGRLGGFPRGLGGGVLNEVVVVVADEVVVVSEAVELEAEERDVGDGRGSRVAGAGAGCLVL